MSYFFKIAQKTKKFSLYEVLSPTYADFLLARYATLSNQITSSLFLRDSGASELRKREWNLSPSRKVTNAPVF